MLKPNGITTAENLADLVYELLDAHVDTIRLAHGQDGDAPLAELGAWPAHLEYLRDLQRVGREALAHLPGPALSSPGPQR